MKTIEEQLNIIQSFVGDGHKIEIQEDGFLSRGFVVESNNSVSTDGMSFVAEFADNTVGQRRLSRAFRDCEA